MNTSHPPSLLPLPHPQRFPRASGLLLHPTSLAGSHGLGDLGAEAYRFVDFLASAGQRLWQVLPLGPTGHGNSPYAARSATAGNPLLISLERLVEQGLLSREDLAQATAFTPGRVDYSEAERVKWSALRRAAETFRRSASARQRGSLEAFRLEHSAWLEDYALFMALRDATGGAPWQSWDRGLAGRDRSTLDAAREAHAAGVDFHVLAQHLFWEQWSSLREYAHERGIRLVGDIPIFVALDSADVWARRHLFWLDDSGNPTVVAGVPPDYFSATGQRWGNPLYRWDVMAGEGYWWWTERFRATLGLVDVARLDHFRGFQACWEIPAGHPTAERGRWAPGSGIAVFDAARRALGELPLIVEDLGVITPDVVELRQDLGYPGMKVLQFAFDSGPSNPFLPHNFEPHVVVYTGTHDNDTTLGWFRTLSEAERAYALRYLGADGQNISWELIRLALSSVADTAIVPAQDVLGLGSEARMNYPGRAEGNWHWRLKPGHLTNAHAERLAELARVYGRDAQPRS